MERSKQFGSLATLVQTLLATLVLTSTPTLADKNNVIELKLSSFNSIVSKHEYALIEFYATWCGYCQEFEPKYNAVADEIRTLNDSILVARVDAPENEELADEFEIEELPTVKWFVKGKEKVQYNGPSEKEPLIKWVKKLLSSPAEELGSALDVEDLHSKADQVSLIGAFQSNEGELYDRFIQMALDSYDVAFYKTTDPSLVEIENTPGFVLVKNISGHPFEIVKLLEPLSRDPDEFTEKIEDFLARHKYPDFFAFDSNSVRNMMDQVDNVEKKFHIHIILAEEEQLRNKDLEEALRESGRALRENVALIVSTRSENSPLRDPFPISATAEVEVFAASTETIRKYKMPSVSLNDLTANHIIDFGTAILEGKADRIWASAPTPEEEKEYRITVLVRDTVDKIAKDPTKDVVVHVYQPEDGESEAFTTDFENLAIAFENVTSVVLAKFNALENEHEDIDFTFDELPVIMLFPAKEGAETILMDTSEGIDIESVGKFVHLNAAIKFDLPDLSEFISDDESDFFEDEDDDFDIESPVPNQGEQDQSKGSGHDEL